MPIMTQSEKEMRRMKQSLGVGVANDQPGSDDMNDGQSQLAVIDGIVNDVKKISGELYHNRIFQTFDDEVDAILNQESLIHVPHKFTGNPILDPGFQSTTFVGGWTGGSTTGYQLTKDDNNEYNFELDNLTVRGSMKVFELLIQQIRATNGSVFITSAAKVESSSGLSAGDDTGTITFEDPSGGSLCPFADGDIILMQRVKPGLTVGKNVLGNDSNLVKKLVYKVTDVNGRVCDVATAGFSNTATPNKGDDFVRVGNVGTGAGGTANRDASIYMTADDANSPFIEMYTGITSYSAWTGTAPKLRLGKLDGITDNDAGLDGNQSQLYGLYSDAVYLKGRIVATSGYIGNGTSGFSISNAAISNGKTTLTDSNAGVYLSTTGIALGANSVFKVTDAGAVTASNMTISGGSLSVGTGNNIFRVDTDGDMWIGHATQGSAKFQVTKGGVITSTSGTIGGWVLSNNALTSATGNVILDQSNQRITLGAKRSLTDTNDGLFLHTTGIALGASTDSGTSSPFQVEDDGTLKATLGTIGGWTITGSQLSSGSGTSRFEFDQAEKKIRIGAKDAFGDSNAGVHIGTDGIALGADNVFTVNNAGAVVASSVTVTGQITSNSGSSSWTNGSLTGGTVGGNTIDGSSRILVGGAGAGQIELKPHASDPGESWIGVVEGGSGPAQTPWRILGNGNAFFGYDSIQLTSSHNIELLCHWPAAGVSSASSYDGGIIFKDMSDQMSETDSTVKKWINLPGDGDGSLLWGYASTGSGSFSTLAFLDASGNWKIDGTVTPSYSDARLKTNLVPMSNSIDKIMQMKPYEFDWVEKRGGEHATGLIAQDMLELMPEIVTKGVDGEHYSIKYQELIPTLINAIQELKQEVEELKNA